MQLLLILVCCRVLFDCFDALRQYYDDIYDIYDYDDIIPIKRLLLISVIFWEKFQYNININIII